LKAVAPDLPYAVPLVHDQPADFHLVPGLQAVVGAQVVETRRIMPAPVQALDPHPGRSPGGQDGSAEGNLAADEPPLEAFLAERAGQLFDGQRRNAFEPALRFRRGPANPPSATAPREASASRRFIWLSF